MASRNKPSAFTAEQVEDQNENNSEDEVVVAEPVTVMSADSNYITARIKGTWKMFWGNESFDFVDDALCTKTSLLFFCVISNISINLG